MAAKVGKGNTQLSVILPDALYLEVVEIAAKKDWSVSQTVRNIVDDWLKAQKAEPGISTSEPAQSSKNSKTR
jgi:hypothetical protein